LKKFNLLEGVAPKHYDPFPKLPGPVVEWFIPWWLGNFEVSPESNKIFRFNKKFQNLTRHRRRSYY